MATSTYHPETDLPNLNEMSTVDQLQAIVGNAEEKGIANGTLIRHLKSYDRVDLLDALRDALSPSSGHTVIAYHTDTGKRRKMTFDTEDPEACARAYFRFVYHDVPNPPPVDPETTALGLLAERLDVEIVAVIEGSPPDVTADVTPAWA